MRDAYSRVWDIKGYSIVRCNKTTEALFFSPYSIESRARQLLKNMGLEPYVSCPSYAEVKKQLQGMLRGEVEYTKGSKEVLNNIANIPRGEGRAYLKLLDADLRLDKKYDIASVVNAYYHQVCRLVNPKNVEFKSVYGASGADVTSLLLSTNSTIAIYVDTSPFEVELLKEAIVLLQRGNLEEIDGGEFFNKDMMRFLEDKAMFSSAVSATYSDGSHLMTLLPWKLVEDLKSLHVDLSRVVFNNRLKENGSVEICFPWRHHFDMTERDRTLIYIPNTDITKPKLYPALLKETLDKGVDAFFMKASFLAPLAYPEFLPTIGKSLNEGGFFLTADYTFDQRYVDPDPCLKDAGLMFARRTTPKLEDHISACEPAFLAVADVQTLISFSPQNRQNRSPGSGMQYKSLLSIRQKEELIDD